MTTPSTSSEFTEWEAQPEHCSREFLPWRSCLHPPIQREFSGLIEGNARQILVQLYGVIAVAIWSGVVSFILLKVIGLLVPLRVNQQNEIEGLDLTQHGEALQ